MTAAITSIAKTSRTTWLYTYTGTAPFRLYQDGALLTTTTATSYEAHAATEPLFQVFDSTEAGPLVAQRITLQFERDDNASYYVIYRETAPNTWTALTRLYQSDALYMQYTTDTLDDVQSHDFRVVAVDALGETNLVNSLTVAFARYPDRPAVTISYTGGNVTVSA